MEELLLPARRRVEQKAARLLEERAPLVVRHAFEHLELHAVARARLRREHEAEREVEQVVRRHAHAHGAEIFRRDRPGEHPLVVRVGLGLGLERRLRPAAQRRLDTLHLHVRAFHDADRDRAAAAGHAGARPFVQLAHHTRRVGNVGLERDAGVHALEPGPVERAHEGLGSEPHVAVFLHVEVDEFRHGRAIGPRVEQIRRGAVEHLEAVAQHAHGVPAGQRGDLRIERRDFHREHLDLGELERLEVFVQPDARLHFAEQRFAEEVHIHPQSLRPPLGEMCREQVRFRGQHDVRGLLLHVLLHQRHGDAGQPAAEGLEPAHEGAVDRAEKSGHALHVEDVGELLRHTRRSLCAKCLVGELHERRLVGGRLQHAVELSLLAALGGCLELSRARLKLAGERDGLLDQGGVNVHDSKMSPRNTRNDTEGSWHLAECTSLKADARS